MNPNKHKPLIVLAGPTAGGKTALAVEAAKRIRGEIVSADSMQVYRGMDIGTAKPTLEERQGIPHHLLDVAEPTETFSAAAYQAQAKAAIADIHSRGNIPILTGGTGFYINAVVYDCDFTETPQDDENALRDAFMLKAAQGENIHQHLQRTDPAAAAEIHPHNIKRVARALAYYEATGGQRISEHNRQMRQKPPAYDLHFIVLCPDRAGLYEAIAQRVHGMMAKGLVDEAAALFAQDGTTAFQAIGYKELLPYLRGEVALKDATAAIIQNTRRYAKRQMTWFRQKAPKGSLWVYV